MNEKRTHISLLWLMLLPMALCSVSAERTQCFTPGEVMLYGAETNASFMADEEKAYGVVNLSVCNMRSKADFSSEMITQALLGMPVRVVEHDNWYRIQTPDDYLGWVHYSAIHPMSKDELTAWNQAEKIIVTAHYGFVRSEADERSQPISDVVAGDRLKWEGSKGKYYKVSYPDDRVGYISKSIAMPEGKWRKALKQDAASILRTAHTLIGVPYLWAGLSSKGMDCSGFVRNVLFMHDILIPRDASQQAPKGERIAIPRTESDYSSAPDCSLLQPGDLLFFGRKATAEKKERVVHVGIYIGEGRFIHSQGDVHISSLLPDDPLFDAFNLGRLLYGSRVLPYINKQSGLTTTLTNEYYK